MATAECKVPPPRVVELTVRMDMVDACILKQWMQNPLNVEESQREASLRQVIFTALHNRGVE